ncbi:nuclear protein localization protein 4 homolog [Ruditapes philippinarum]|uniref:nuclear protein localization protein 4 homolog n=1 Tax=Ruditapes philippinarum TaxID=129788 RepID=UPI00295BADE0|nr:nuclear protein localization protein 4 homolog [Ruditapes philippinarum]
MSRGKAIVVRIQSPDAGTKRIDTKGNESVAEFLNKVQKTFEIGDIGWTVYKTREKKDALRNSRAKTLDSYKIKHGDMLYLFPQSTHSGAGERPGSSSSVAMDTSPFTTDTVKEDEVDLLMYKEDGKIYRKRDEQLCHHGPSGKCLHCVPLEPFDETYLQTCDPPIKYLSFHSYLRKLTSGVDKGKFANLENVSCKIKEGCKEHPPWPAGICTKCQPTALTLNRQRYRHVDYIMFENPNICNQFLNYWRSTGNQRLGIMYGRYGPHKDIPLAIKAEVAAIYEPPQINSKNKIELLEDPQEEAIHRLTLRLGLVPVGWIFTDLVADDLTTGTVKNFRGNVDSHFLSAEECIMAAQFQNKYPNPCKYSKDGHFGSKFVTVIVTGDQNGQIHFEGYQVSNVCMALVRDECLIPTKDAPELGYIKESSNEQYVPDVFFKDKDEYGNEVTQLARPLPVEYLLVDMGAAFPVEPQFTFKMADKPFPKENRNATGEVQDFNALTSYMHQFTPDKFYEAVSDFHLLLYLSTTDMLPLKERIGSLLEAIKSGDEGLAHHFKKTEEWATVEEMMAAHGTSSPTLTREGSYVGPGASPLPPIGASGGVWTCAHCTFHNKHENQNCEMCSLPRQ